MTILRFSFLLIVALAATTTAQPPPPPPPPPAPTAAINLTAILEKGGQYTTFIRLLNTTQAGQQVENQVKNSNEGMTIFAPTDNAFQILKPGTINGLTTQQQVQLILYHVLPKFYSFESFQTASNPVRTQATGNDGKPFSLTVTYLGVKNVNLSTGVVSVTINNALRSTLPLAVYQVDKVLLPEELFSAKAPKSSPHSAEAPESDSDKAKSPEAEDNGKSGAYGLKTMGLPAVVAIVLVTMAVLL